MFRVSDLCSFLVCLPLSSTNNIRPFGHHLEKDISEPAKGGALITDSKGIYDALTRNLSSLTAGQTQRNTNANTQQEEFKW